jgi:hypothetical protein
MAMSPFPSIHFQKEVILGQVIVSNFLNLPDLSTDKNQAKITFLFMLGRNL